MRTRALVGMAVLLFCDREFSDASRFAVRSMSLCCGADLKEDLLAFRPRVIEAAKLLTHQKADRHALAAVYDLARLSREAGDYGLAYLLFRSALNMADSSGSLIEKISRGDEELSATQLCLDIVSTGITTSSRDKLKSFLERGCASAVAMKDSKRVVQFARCYQALGDVGYATRLFNDLLKSKKLTAEMTAVVAHELSDAEEQSVRSRSERPYRILALRADTIE